MMGVDFIALCILHGKYRLIEDTCFVGSNDPVRIKNAIKYYLREERQAELVHIVKTEPF